MSIFQKRQILKGFISSLACALILAFALPVQAKLGDKEWKSLVKQLKIAASQREYAKAASLIDEIATDDSKRAYSLIKKFTQLMPDADVYVAARNAMSNFSDKAAVSALVKDIEKSRKLTIKTLLIDATANRSDAASIEAVNSTLSNKLPQIVRSALITVTKRRHKSSVAPLIELMSEHEAKKKAGLLVINTKKALFKITGKNLELAEDYRIWWKENGGSFRSDDAPTTGDYEPKESGSVERVKKPSFFGSEIMSRRVVFVIDTSGSMKTTDPVGPGSEGSEGSGQGNGSGREESGGKGGGKGKKGEGRAPVSPSRVRLKRAQFQLSYALSKLPKDTKFSIIAYNGGFPTPVYTKKLSKQKTGGWLHIWNSSLQGVTPKNIKSAQDFVNKFQANGATYTLNAMRAAFEVPGVDNIILLSDGGPNDPKQGGATQGTAGRPGDSLSMEEILTRINKLNAIPKIRIDTFGFEAVGAGGVSMSGGYVDFLKRMAEANSGKFTPIR